jgi:phosphate uptake regulator
VITFQISMIIVRAPVAKKITAAKTATVVKAAAAKAEMERIAVEATEIIKVVTVKKAEGDEKVFNIIFNLYLLF